MKKILISIIIVLLLTTIASALTITGDNTLSMCQCETVSKVYNVCATQAGNYAISFEGSAEQWVKVAPQSISLNAGQCKDVYVFVTPECYATSGNFSFNLNVSGIKNATKNISVFVEQCHTFNYTITPTSNTSKPCEPNYFNIYIKNTGKFSDEFTLMQTGLDDSWVTYPRETFVLGPNGELNTTLEVKSLCSASAGNYNFSLALSNTQTNASQSKNLSQEIISFTPITSNLSASQVVCSENGKDINISITNVSLMEDNLSFSISDKNFLSLNKSNLILNPSETQNIILSILPTTPQDTNFVFSIYSNNYKKEYVVNVDLSMEDCYNVSLVRKESQTNYCLGNNTQTFIVSNNGTKNVNVIVSAEGISTEDVLVGIPTKTSKEVALNFVAEEGTKNIKVTAGTDYSQSSINYDLVFENCYGAELLVPSIETCAGVETIQKVILKNNGTKTQNFELSTNAIWIEINDSEVSVDANSEKEIDLVINAPQEITETYSIKAESDNATLERTLSVVLLNENVCYGFNVQKNIEVIDVNCCSGEITEMLIKNTGQFTQELSLEKIAPDWVSFSHTEIVLGNGEEKIVYVYFSPPAGTNGVVQAKINISNQKNINQEIDFNLNVFGGNCGVALTADLDVNNDVTLTKIFTRKEVDIEFLVKNDSNVGFNILDIMVTEFPNSEVEFEKGIFLEPNQSTKARITLSFLENYEPQNQEVEVKIVTSVGDFTKKQYLALSDNNAPIYDEVAITGFLTQFVAPAAGILLLIIILVVIILVVGKKQKKTKIKKK